MTAGKRVIICGAAGRDFHNFNQVFRDDSNTHVVAFTATQIPGIDDRYYPAALAGPLYPQGIPIHNQDHLKSLCVEQDVDEVVFAYSDVTFSEVMSVACTALAAGANFSLLGPKHTMLKATVPCLSICAVRTGCGKSQIARFIAGKLTEAGVRVVVIRHPMPYGNLTQQAVQRFALMADLDEAHCTIEEREEYEPHIAAGQVVYAGADYAAIVAQAQAEADVLIWDGGNNDFAFVEPDLAIVVVDALRPDQLDTHYPGAAVLLAADLVVVNKTNAATEAQLKRLDENLVRLVPNTPVTKGASAVSLDQEHLLQNRRVMVVEDGPTITHGGMPHGAGYHAIQKANIAELIDPHNCAAALIAEVFAKYPHIGPVLPAIGYSRAQRQALKETIDQSAAEVIVAGTPADLAHLLDTHLPIVRAHYDFVEQQSGDLMAYITPLLAAQPAAS